MTDWFTDRVVLITGAVGELSEAMSRGFAPVGAHVVVAARLHHKTDGTKLAGEIGNKAIFWPARRCRRGKWVIGHV